jgi:hypothetical protein
VEGQILAAGRRARRREAGMEGDALCCSGPLFFLRQSPFHHSFSLSAPPFPHDPPEQRRVAVACAPPPMA